MECKNNDVRRTDVVPPLVDCISYLIGPCDSHVMNILNVVILDV